MLPIKLEGELGGLPELAARGGVSVLLDVGEGLELAADGEV